MTEAVHTPLPWAYRPGRHDDWGYIRGPAPMDAEIAPLVAVAKSGLWESVEMLDEHRSKRTDPYAANAALIVTAVNERPALLARLAELEVALEAIAVAGPLEEPKSNSDVLGYFSDDPDDHFSLGWDHGLYHSALMRIKDDQISACAKEISRLRQALLDIAESEPIPTPMKAWEFCRDVASAALKEIAP